MKKRMLSLLLAVSLLAVLLPSDTFATKELMNETESAPSNSETSSSSVSDEDTVPESVPEESSSAESDSAVPASESAAESPQPTETASAEASSAAETADVSDDELETFLPNTDILPDSNELFAGFVEKTFYDYGEIATFGVLGQDRLTGTEKIIYDNMKAEITAIANGERTSSYFVIDISNQNIPYSQGRTLIDGEKIWRLLMADCPYELYWYDKTVAMQYGVSGKDDLGIAKTYVYKFPVAKAYAASTYVVDITKTGAASLAKANAMEIVAANAGKTDAEKLEAYKQTICGLVGYNYSVSTANYVYGDPWQVIYVFDGDSTTDVVCEGYAKAFQYLCDLSDFTDGSIACYSVTGSLNGGTASGSHMWNVVTIDSKNYMADLTNSDANTIGQNGALFLVPAAEGDVDSGYTINIGSSALHYQYADTAKALFGTDILTLAVGKAAPTISISAPTASQTALDIGYTEPPTISVKASGDGIITYQWYLRGEGTRGSASDTPVGANAKTFTLPANLAAGSYVYYCIATCGGDSAGSAEITITVGEKAEGTLAANSGNEYKTSYIYSGNAIAEPASDNYVTNAGEISFSWYTGNATRITDLKAGNALHSAPSAVGTYTLYVHAAESDACTAADLFVPVSIQYLEISDEVSFLPAEPEAGGWYRESVTILPPSGYTISTDKSTYSASVRTDDGGSVVYYLKNVAGEITAPRVASVKIDAQAPVIGTITYSKNSSLMGWLFNNNQITVSVPVTDVLSGVDKVTYTLTPQDGEPAAARDAVLSGTTYTFEVNKTFKGAISIAAYDCAGNSASVSAQRMAVEDGMPALTVSAKANSESAFGTEWYATAQTIYISVQDAVSGLQSITYTVDGTEQTPLFTASNSDASLSTDVKNLEIPVQEGEHTYVVTAVDNAQNSVSSGAIVIKQDASSPAVPTLSVTTAATDTTAVLTASASDTGSGIANYALTEQNGKIDPITSNNSGVFSLQNLTPNTSYSFVVTVTDYAGNTAESAPCPVTTSIPAARAADVVLEGIDSLVYNGKSQLPTSVKVKLDGQVVPAGQYDVAYSNSNGGAENTKNAGIVTVTVTAKTGGSYSGSTATYTIAPAVPKITWAGESQTVNYTGRAAAIVAPSVTLVNGEAYSGTISYSYRKAGEAGYTEGLPADAGSYSVRASIAAGGNYSGANSADLTLTIQKQASAVGTVSYQGKTIYLSTSIANINAGLVYSGSASGTLTLESDTVLSEGTADYPWVFTPADKVNYTTETGTIRLTVSRDNLVSIGVGNTEPEKKSYQCGEPFDLSGLTVTAEYASGGTKDITGLVVCSTLHAGDISVTLSYTEGGITKTCSVGITSVTKKQLDVSGMRWSIDSFDYDASQHGLSLLGVLPEGVVAAKTGDTATNPGDYTAKAVFSLADGYDADTYEIVGTNPLTQGWKISASEITGTKSLGKSIRYTNTGEQKITAADFGITVAGSFSLGQMPADLSILAAKPETGADIRFRLAEGLSFNNQTLTIPLVFTPSDSGYLPVSLTLTITLANKDTATLNLTADPGSAVYGDSVTYTASVDKDHRFLNAFDAINGTISFYLADSAESKLIKSFAVSGSGTSASITLDKETLSAGSHTVFVQYSGNSNYAAVSTSITTAVAQKQLTWDTSDMWAAKLADGNAAAELKGTLKIAGEIIGGDAGFTYSSMEGVYDRAEAGERTVTVTVSGAEITNPNYKLPPEAPVFTGRIAAVTELAPSTASDGKVYQLEYRSGITSVPSALAGNVNLNTPNKITAQMRLSISSLGMPADNIEVFDLVLRYRSDASQPWTDVTADNFPADGVLVVLPYPQGTNAANFDFVVTHMFTTGMNAGSTETITPEKTADGLKFTLHSLSPVAVGYKAISSTDTKSTYKISTWVTDGGVATPPATVNIGVDYTVDITPAAGYKVSRVVVDGQDIGAVQSYTFYNVHLDHTLGVYFVKGSSASGNPKTGDTAPFETPLSVFGLSGMALFAISTILKKKKFT